MAFADLKNDYIFRRIFGSHPELLRGLLNDLLERSGDTSIEEIEYLPSEQMPLAAGAKLSIMDVRCKDRAGTRFVVEMQLIHMRGFLNRVVYNACKGYAEQLATGQPYTALSDVVAISICDFELWPDAEQDENHLARVPMLSRWYVTERTLDSAREPNRLLQVQYAFLELPKIPKEKPSSGAGLWAWLFANAPKLTEVPADMPPGPQRSALDLAREARMTYLELEAYRRVADEIQQARDYGEEKEAKGRAKGLAEGTAIGLAQGTALGLAKGVLALLSARGLAVTDESRARIEGCTELERLQRWLIAAAHVATVEEVFADP